MTKPRQLKVAIVHDWLVGGGAELVVEQLHKMYPDAPIYTSYCTDEWRKRLNNKVVTGYLQKWPFSKLRKYIPVLRIFWFARLDFSEYDLVISSSGNGEAKSIKTKEKTLHVCYCHAPTHFYWRHYKQYLKYPGFGPFASAGLRLLSSPLRRWDKKAVQRPDYIIANSSYIQSDIKRYYGRESNVIHPPVNTKRFSSLKAESRHGFVTVGRQVPYKKVDIIIEASNKIGASLKVIGRGPQHQKLAEMARETVSVLEKASDSDVNNAMVESEAFILAAFEDFGITPVEALAAGTPVIAYKKGGALDYVIPGKTGEFFEEQTAESLAKVLKKFDASKYNHKEISKFAEKFSEKEFQSKMRKFLEEKLDDKS